MVGSTATLTPGSDATVSVEEDEENDIVYYNFGIPRGDKGNTGDTQFTKLDVVNGKLIAYYSRDDEPYRFQLNGNKLEVVFDE